jgi:hypothetical protein
MRSKKLLFSSFVLLGGLTAYLSLTSSSGGVMGNSTSGCSCHGAANSATTLEITGIPATGWVAGTAYPLTVSVKNSTKAAAGFDMTVTAGVMSNAPANTMLMGGIELHHTALKLATSGSTSWNFTWTAPATGSSVDFNIAGNAVNNQNDTNGDEWATTKITFNKAIPASVESFEKGGLSVYPNPAQDFIILKSASDLSKASIQLATLTGSMIQVNKEVAGNNEWKINTSSLPSGHYFLVLELNGKIYNQSIHLN